MDRIKVRTALFQKLFQEHASYVWSSLRRLGVRFDDLEDLTHDVFVAVFQQLDQFDQSRPARPWLFGIAFRVASAHRRRASVKREQIGHEAPEPHDESPGALDRLAEGQSREILYRALQSLSFEQRATFVMAELDEVPMKEVASILGIPLNTAYSRVRLAREHIERSLRADREEVMP